MKTILLSEEDECEDDDNGDSHSIFQVSDWGFTRKFVSSVLYIFKGLRFSYHTRMKMSAHES
ncbi:unnamed protein product [Prunus brigantina]